MTKLTRKQLLKNQDPLSLAAKSGTAWLAQHGKLLLAAGAVAMIAVVSVWAGTNYNSQQEQETAAQFARGWRILQEGYVEDPSDDPAPLAASDGNAKLAAEPAKMAKGMADATKNDPNRASSASLAGRETPKSSRVETAKAARDGAEEDPALAFASAHDKWKAARTIFADLLGKAGYKGIGIAAAFLQADLDDRLGDHEAAESTFGRLADTLKPQDPLYFLAAERLAYAKERRHDAAAAIAALAPLAGDDKLFYADYAQFHQARLYMAGHEDERARALLEHLQRSFPNSSLSDEIHGQIEILSKNSKVQADAAPAPAAQATAKGAK